jgi:hypothetical protein
VIHRSLRFDHPADTDATGFPGTLIDFCLGLSDEDQDNPILTLALRGQVTFRGLKTHDFFPVFDAS